MDIFFPRDKNGNKINIAIIDNFFNEEELNKIHDELSFLQNKLLPPERSGSATNEDGQILKRNSSIFLHDFYTKKENSDIEISLTKTLDYNLIEKMVEYDPIFRLILNCNVRYSLVSYYDNKDYYLPHTDSSVFTILSWFNKSPEDYSGGEFYLKDFDYTIESKTNRVVYLPSVYLHEVKPIKMHFGGKNGRFCVSQFLLVKSPT